MNRIKTLVWGLLLFSTLNANDTIWQGTIGKSKIYMYLPCEPAKEYDEKKNDCGYGEYFYVSQLQSIKMETALSPSEKYAVRLQVLHSMEEDATSEEAFSLNYKNGMLVGRWESKKSKALTVKLQRYKIKKPSQYLEEDYYRIREKYMEFKRGKVEKFAPQKKELVWIKETKSGVDMFRLGNGFSAKSRKKLNPIFDASHTADSIAYLTCSSRWDYGSGMEALSNEVTYLSTDLLGYSNFMSYFCGGAHPDFGTSYLLYDLHNGKRYRLEDIVVFSKNMPKHTEKYSRDWSNYANGIQAETLRALAFKAAGMKLKAQKQSDDMYDPYALSHWQYMDWSYEKKGIRFFLNFCTAARCFRGDSYLIPFKLLAPYKNKNFPYKFGDKKAFQSK